tara:strand:- start:1427 stop:1618 length:192 start_codon:yes stop_codon:yes gene_type:complete
MSTEKNTILDELLSLVEGAQEDNAKFFDRGNAAAGTRIRKTMQEVKTLAQQLRVDVQEAKNTQ